MSARFLPAHQHWLPPNLATLLPETQQAVLAWLHRQAPHSPAEAFAYQALPPSGRLTYELVGWHNFTVYFSLFGADPSPFVDARYKSRAVSAARLWHRSACAAARASPRFTRANRSASYFGRHQCGFRSPVAPRRLCGAGRAVRYPAVAAAARIAGR